MELVITMTDETTVNLKGNESITVNTILLLLLYFVALGKL